MQVVVRLIVGLCGRSGQVGKAGHTPRTRTVSALVTQPEHARQSERVIFTASLSSVTVCDHPPCGGLGPPSSSSWIACARAHVAPSDQAGTRLDGGQRRTGALFIAACSVGAIMDGPPTSSLNPPPAPPLQHRTTQSTEPAATWQAAGATRGCRERTCPLRRCRPRRRCCLPQPAVRCTPATTTRSEAALSAQVGPARDWCQGRSGPHVAVQRRPAGREEERTQRAGRRRCRSSASQLPVHRSRWRSALAASDGSGGGDGGPARPAAAARPAAGPEPEQPHASAHPNLAGSPARANAANLAPAPAR